MPSGAARRPPAYGWRVTRLIHLNGPPGIGKSTLSALYVDRHPGVLNLDIDSLHQLVGGWRDDPRTHDILKPVALAMADAHVRGGRDVIVPQFRARVSEIEAFARVAEDVGADFVEIVLLADRADAVARFDARDDDTDWNRHNREVVAGLGGDAFLGSMYDGLVEALASRPAAVILPSVPGEIEETYRALLRALGEPGA